MDPGAFSTISIRHAENLDQVRLFVPALVASLNAAPPHIPPLLFVHRLALWRCFHIRVLQSASPQNVCLRSGCVLSRTQESKLAAARFVEVLKENADKAEKLKVGLDSAVCRLFAGRFLTHLDHWLVARPAC